MSELLKRRLRVWPLVLMATALCVSASVSYGQKSGGKIGQDAGRAFPVDGRVALASLIALSDGHLQKMADSLRLVAATDAARSADWEKIKGPLSEVEKINVPALIWFALPDGSFWTAQEGRSRESLATRPYFPRVLAGQTVIGDLVVSKTTGKSVAIIAVPILRRDKSVAGALGCSVYLDKLSALLEQEMDLDSSVIFYSFDAAPLLALVWDPGLIFVEPKKLGEEVSRAFTEMLSKEQGIVKYKFRGESRTVLYRKSPLTGWRYAFGLVESE